VLALLLALFSSATDAMTTAEVIDRIMAVVLQQPILLSDVTAARSLQLVQVPPDSADPTAAVLDALIERALMLSEVERYQPPEPAASEIDARVADITRRVGSPEAVEKLMAATGMTLDRLRLYLRADLRLTTYLNQRFGASSKPSDEEVLAYYREHAAEFTSGGNVQPFDAVSDSIRERLAQTRRMTLINDWTASLRRRADVTMQYVPKAAGQK
jgi:hypothetical protein